MRCSGGFVVDVNKIAMIGHLHAVKHGFYGDNPPKAIYKKVCEENKEFYSAVIGNAYSDIEAFENTDTFSEEEWMARFESEIKNSVGDELADIIITALAGSRELGIDIEKHISAKMEYNKSREY